VPARTLDELRAQLLFNNTVELWITLCRERGWRWRDASSYERVVAHLRVRGVSLQPSTVRHPLRELEPGRQVENFTVRLDDRTMAALRDFKPATQ